MTKENLIENIKRLEAQRQVHYDAAEKLSNEIKPIQYELDKLNSMEIAPKILDPMIGKIIIINRYKINYNNLNDFFMIRLLSWKIDPDCGSCIILYYDRGLSCYNNGKCRVPLFKYDECTGKLISNPYPVPVSILKYFELYENSELKKSPKSKWIDLIFK